MRILLILITAIFFSIVSFSQKVETKYFDKKGNVVNPKKAKYKETTTTYDEGKIKKTNVKLYNNCTNFVITKYKYFYYGSFNYSNRKF